MESLDTPPSPQELDGDRVLYLSGDCMRLLEDEYWAELDTDILMGWKTHEEASDAFLAWRSGYKVVEIALDN